MENIHSFQDREEWRNWLKDNYRKESFVWIILFKKKYRKKGLTLEDTVEEAICFGWIDGKLKRVDAKRFSLRFSPRKKKSVWSRINRDKAEQLIAEGKMTPAGLVKIEEARSNGTWENAYTNKKKEKMPADLKEALSGNKAAWENFQKFANSYRNMYIGWVNDAKTDTTRKRRISEVVKRSVINKKPGIE